MKACIFNHLNTNTDSSHHQKLYLTGTVLYCQCSVLMTECSISYTVWRVLRPSHCPFKTLSMWWAWGPQEPWMPPKIRVTSSWSSSRARRLPVSWQVSEGSIGMFRGSTRTRLLCLHLHHHLHLSDKCSPPPNPDFGAAEWFCTGLNCRPAAEGWDRNTSFSLCSWAEHQGSSIILNLTIFT